MLGRYSIENLVGRSLKGYRIDRFLARGGMGVVFEGTQESLGRPVAIKILYPHLSEDGQFRERFEREARAAARLIHPNIVRVLDFGFDDGLYFMVQDLVHGESLRDRLARVGADDTMVRPAIATSYVEQIANALSYAHRLGYVHRDVKPGNVLLTRDGHASLTDFGVVKVLGDSQLTAHGLIIGTPEYMAPEQGSGEVEIGPAADQYSLAVVAYELLVGRVPFKANTPVSVMRMHLTDPPPDPRSIAPWFPETVAAVLMRALSKQPGQRFESVDAFASALLAATGTGAQTTVAAVPPPPPTPIPSIPPASLASGGGAPPEPPATLVAAGGAQPSPAAGPRWSRLPALGVGIVALALILAMGGFLLRGNLFGSSGDDQRGGVIGGTPTPTETLAPTSTSPATTAAVVVPSGSPDATPTDAGGVPPGMMEVILFASTRGGVHDSQVFVMNLDGSNQRQLTSSQGHTWAPVVSPDGTVLMFSTVIGHHVHSDPSGGALAGESNNHDIYVADLVGDSEDTLQAINLENVTATSLAWDNGWSWSPDGKRIAFSSDREGNYEIYTMAADGSDVRRLTNDPASDGWPVWTPDGRTIIFSSNRTGDEEIFSMDIDGGNLRQLTDRPDTFDVFPSISPDGRQIAFSSQIPGIEQGAIWIMDINGSNLRRVTNAAALDNIPDWCPDGKQIVFMSNRDGNPNGNVYIMAADGSNVTRLTTTDTRQDSIAGDQTPQCTYVRRTTP